MTTAHTPRAITALSPLDGRYADKLGELRAIMSEHGYMRARVQVEITWLLALTDAGLAECPALPREARAYLLELIHHFSEADTLAIKAIEARTNHDVKAVEYWLRERLQTSTLDANSGGALAAVAEFVHFACTSEDINNTSHALQLQAAQHQVLLPLLQQVLQHLRALATRHASVPMLSRTHGQTATPTTVGKEFANFVARLDAALVPITQWQPRAKMNGAVGNYNAHCCAYPEVDWPAFAQGVVTRAAPSAQHAPEVPFGLGLAFQPYSTQIEPHDSRAQWFDALARSHTILIDLARDVWGYISLGYFKQGLKDGEIGSSTMPHKVNPIDFENAEGNLGLANALLGHLSSKLPVSRWQRDLSDSTVLRNMGVALGHGVLAYQSLLTGLRKLELNPTALAADLNDAWEVLAEPIQTVMRRYAVPGAYEQLKAATRGKHVGRDDLHALIKQLPIPAAEQQRLLALTPADYIGLAAELARRV
ncbi:MAG: adenylosuccinate lyase [Burkholderiaceae bacterium]